MILKYHTCAIISRSWLQATLEYKPYIRAEFSEKTSLKNKEMVFENGVKNIQAAAYNGARTVHCFLKMYPIFVGSVLNFGMYDDHII